MVKYPANQKQTLILLWGPECNLFDNINMV